MERVVRLLGFCILSAVLLLPVHAADNKKDDPNQIGNRDVGKGINFYSLEKEIALGKQLAAEVARQGKMLDDPLLAEYVNRVGQNLVRNSDAKVPFTFRVIESDDPNAFALPGGYVFVNTGLIQIAEEEDEFAGALAHEIAHVAARHSTRRETKSELANIATIPLSVLLGGWSGAAVRVGAGVAVPMTFLSFTRKDEAEADYLGLQYMYAAGYDPTGQITILEKLGALNRQKPSGMARLVSTHPMDTERIQNAQKEIQKILPARPEYVVTTSEYYDMRQRMFVIEARRKPDEPENRPTLVRPSGNLHEQ
ncbi:MAG TPA: M48 family metallopeptidase [Bryobacteraceae bacterium]|nr:M48 family metallopeptidase [Bryobacteraceae bacterium]